MRPQLCCPSLFSAFTTHSACRGEAHQQTHSQITGDHLQDPDRFICESSPITFGWSLCCRSVNSSAGQGTLLPSAPGDRIRATGRAHAAVTAKSSRLGVHPKLENRTQPVRAVIHVFENRQDSRSDSGNRAGPHFCPDSPPISSVTAGVLRWESTWEQILGSGVVVHGMPPRPCGTGGILESHPQHARDRRAGGWRPAAASISNYPSEIRESNSTLRAVIHVFEKIARTARSDSGNRAGPHFCPDSPPISSVTAEVLRWESTWEQILGSGVVGHGMPPRPCGTGGILESHPQHARDRRAGGWCPAAACDFSNYHDRAPPVDVDCGLWGRPCK